MSAAVSHIPDLLAWAFAVAATQAKYSQTFSFFFFFLVRNTDLFHHVKSRDHLRAYRSGTLNF